jgi:hypothetical protein
MPPAVNVVIDGRLIPSSQPAVIVAGTVTAPVNPYLSGLASSIAVDEERGTIVFVRGDAFVVVTVGRRLARLGKASVALPLAPFLRDGSPFIPLAAVARGLGAVVSFDDASKTLNIGFPGPHPPLVTLAPYAAVPGAPAPSPFRVDPTATPRPTFTGIPQPRRTPIEAVPSRP